jgi:hypothetical protein
MLIIIVMSLVTLFFVAFCIICNLAWGDNLETIVIENIPQNIWFSQILTVCYIMAVFLTFPIQFYTAIIILEEKV